MKKNSENREPSINGIKSIILDCIDKSGITVSQIILFGSRARGDFGEDSDFDILIVIKDDIDLNQRKDLWEEVYKALHKNFPIISFDIFVKTAVDFEKERDVVNTVSNEAYTEGMKI